MSLPFSVALGNFHSRIIWITMTFLIAIMSFANFVFYPLVIGTLVAVVIEQIFRARGSEDNPKDVRNVMLSMGIRKYFIDRHGSLT